MKPSHAIKSYIEELQWYLKVKAQDYHIQIPMIRPFIFDNPKKETMQALFFLLEDIKGFIEDME